jgi:hypothetical protein
LNISRRSQVQRVKPKLAFANSKLVAAVASIGGER